MVRTCISRSFVALLVMPGAIVAYAQPGGGPGGGVPVVVCPVAERDLPASARLVGTVLAERSAVVAAEVHGALIEFGTREGDFLKKGAPLARIDADVAAMWLDESRSRLQSLEAALAELLNGERPEELRRLEAAVAENQAMVEKWAFERERVKGLFERSQSNAKEQHDTEMEYLAAQRRLSQAQAEFERARNGARAEVVSKARHDVAAQAAIVRRLERDVAKTVIRAPFDGFVTRRLTEVGEWIEAGGPVAEMVAIDTVKVRVDVPESAIRFAQAGRSATVEIEALTWSTAAPIARIIPQALTASRSFPIEIDLPNPDHRILPGMFVWANVPTGPDGRRLMVSKDAVVARGTQKQVFVIRPGPNGAQMAMPIDVQTGLEVGPEVEVQGAGLSPGDQVVCRANERLMGPVPVSVLSAGAGTTQPAPAAEVAARP